MHVDLSLIPKSPGMVVLFSCSPRTGEVEKVAQAQMWAGDPRTGEVAQAKTWAGDPRTGKVERVALAKM